MSVAKTGGFRICSEEWPLVAAINVVSDGDSCVWVCCRGAWSIQCCHFLSSCPLSELGSPGPLCPFWEVPNIFFFFTSQPESDSIACTQALLLLLAFTTGHCHCHHFRQSQEQTPIKLAPQSSPDTIVIHVTIFVTSKINSFTIRLLNYICQGSEQETEIPPSVSAGRYLMQGNCWRG